MRGKGSEEGCCGDVSSGRGILKDTGYTQDYYEEHKDAGLDYLVYGEWHRSYADAVTRATLQETYEAPAVLDVGCACGALLKGFAETGIYARLVGIDLSRHMIKLGRGHFGFSARELLVAPANRIPSADGALSFVHSGQVLEHIPDDQIEGTFAEFCRVLRPGGRMFHNLAALKHGDSPNVHDGDPTHVNVRPTLYWAEKMVRAGFVPDFESYDRFARSPNAPGEGWPSFFANYEIWTNLAMIKPVMSHSRSSTIDVKGWLKRLRLS